MIDDIVLLPRRLKQFKRTAEVSSEVSCCPPISNIQRVYGFESPSDDMFIEFGAETDVPTGVDTWFRFKLIENTIHGIVEYFCLSESPIDVLHIGKSKKTLLYCLWVAVTDPKTYKRRKYILWENVRALMRFEIDETKDVPIEAAIADELGAFNDLLFYPSPEIIKLLVNYPSRDDIVRISEFKPEVNGQDLYLTIGANIRALSDIYAFEDDWHRPDPIDVLRGVELPEKWTDTSPLSTCAVLKLLLWGPVLLKEIMYLLSPSFGLHCFQRGFMMEPLPSDTEINVERNDDREVFSIIEYIEAIPYGEFELAVSSVQPGYFRRYNPFDMNIQSRTLGADHTQAEDTVVKKVIHQIRELKLQNVVSVHVARSWAEEVYITFRYANDKCKRYYVDLSVHALCSRSLIRDYQVPLFTLS